MNNNIRVFVCAGGVCFSQPVHSRQVVEVLDASSGPDGDSVDLVVQPVQEEAQELLSVLLAARGQERRMSAEGRGCKKPFFFYIYFKRLFLSLILDIFTFSPRPFDV